MGPTRSRASAATKPRGKSHPGMADAEGGPPSLQNPTNIINLTVVKTQENISEMEDTEVMVEQATIAWNWSKLQSSLMKSLKLDGKLNLLAPKPSKKVDISNKTRHFRSEGTKFENWNK